MLQGFIVGLAVVTALILAVAAYAATRPNHFKVARAVTIAAPPGTIYPLIADLARFNTWNPFARKDPTGTTRYEGPPRGVGAGFTFAGPNAGTGRLDVVDTVTDAAVVMRLRMTKPLPADNRITFTLDPQGGATRVTWAMEGAVPFVGKLVSLVMDCDRMVGPDFEAGLADLKALAERGAGTPGRTDHEG